MFRRTKHSLPRFVTDDPLVDPAGERYFVRDASDVWVETDRFGFEHVEGLAGSRGTGGFVGFNGDRRYEGWVCMCAETESPGKHMERCPATHVGERWSGLWGP